MPLIRRHIPFADVGTRTQNTQKKERKIKMHGCGDTGFRTLNLRPVLRVLDHWTTPFLWQDMQTNIYKYMRHIYTKTKQRNTRCGVRTPDLRLSLSAFNHWATPLNPSHSCDQMFKQISILHSYTIYIHTCIHNSPASFSSFDNHVWHAACFCVTGRQKQAASM